LCDDYIVICIGCDGFILARNRCLKIDEFRLRLTHITLFIVTWFYGKEKPMFPAARISDMEACPSGGGAIMTGEVTVLIEGLPAARVGDSIACSGGPITIESGAPKVVIGGSNAARMTDSSCHGGKIVKGAATVLIGNGGGGRSSTMQSAHSNAAPFARG
jgi:uncharacterized Zn-binding protein involved in type VI secretion